jgi:hypothetical protein
VSLNGKLEDVSLSDVMQFIHLGRRTGTLSLTRAQAEAEIGFHRGQIVSAWAPGSKRLATLLVDRGLVDASTMGELVRAQSSELPRRSLGQVLVSTGTLDFETIRKAIEEQIEATIYDLVRWTSGSFEFALDELKPIDDIAMYPGDVIPKLNLNTQMVLLEAARLLDEGNRDSVLGDAAPEHPTVVEPGPPTLPPPSEPARGEEMSLATVADTLEGIEDIDIPLASDEEVLPEAAHRRLQIVSPDRQVAEQVAEIILPEIAQVVRVPLREAGNRLPGEPSPTVVVLDMREGCHTVEDLLAIRRSRPRSSVIALIDSQEMTTRAFDSGAVAAIPANAGALAACFHSLIRNLPDANGSRGQATVKAGFARLRRVLADIRSGLLSATMALNLMHIVSESVERAILFLVRKDDLSALGAFGFSADGQSLAEVTRALVVSLREDNVLTRCIADGQPRSMSFENANLPATFANLIGRPHNGQIVVFPVMGASRVISVVYTDNGSNSRAIEDIELLELATAQVGVAFENELLRRQLGDGPQD